MFVFVKGFGVSPKPPPPLITIEPPRVNPLPTIGGLNGAGLFVLLFGFVVFTSAFSFGVKNYNPKGLV